jgi:hypothetical protein
LIRLFPDYGRDWPLWENSTPERQTDYTTTPEDYGLSPELTGRLAAWNRFWETHSGADGWDDDASEAQWRLEGERIAAQLRREVAGFADVSYEP